MTLFNSKVTETHSFHYRNGDEVSFFLNDETLTATISTERLYMRSVNDSEIDRRSYTQLFGNVDVMRLYGDGKTRTSEQIAGRIKDEWAALWEKRDPYSALAVFKNDDEKFIGNIMLQHVVAGTEQIRTINWAERTPAMVDRAKRIEPGQAELAYCFMPLNWRQGFGKEAATAVVTEYAPATVKEGYIAGDKPLDTIVATARIDNPGSVKILQTLGMQLVKTEETYGALRHHFSIKLTDIAAV